MAKSTQLIADAKSVIANGPSSVTTANAIAQAGKIVDYVGTSKLLLLKLQEAELLQARLITGTDSGTDGTNLTLLQGVQAALNGTGGPSTQLLTDEKTVYNNGPSTVTKATAIQQQGPIEDYQGNTKLVIRKLEEANITAGLLIYDTDASTDAANLALLNGIQQSLV
jgi:hypothetical protein